MAFDLHPIIPWNNILANCSYAFAVGTESTGSPLPEAWTWDCLRPTIITSDAAGEIQFTVAFAVLPDTPTAFIIGAHRHDSAGYRFSGGSVAIDYWDGVAWSPLVAASALAAQLYEPEIFDLPAHVPSLTGYRITLTGLAANADIAIPELFLGPVLTMPYIKLPYDPQGEEWKGPKFEAESGRIYEYALAVRYLFSPSFIRIDAATAANINTFREQHIEQRLPFWWFWAPGLYPQEGFMVKHKDSSMRMPFSNPPYRSLSLNLVEAV